MPDKVPVAKVRIDWADLGLQYATNPSIRLVDIARHTGRKMSTVRYHYYQLDWARLRRETTEKRLNSRRERLQDQRQKFEIQRERLMLKISRKTLHAISSNLDADAKPFGHGRDKVDAFQLAATLKALDESTLAGKVAAQLTPMLFETLDRAATTAMIAEKLKEFRAAQQQSQATKPTTASTPNPVSADARVASHFSRRNGSS